MWEFTMGERLWIIDAECIRFYAHLKRKFKLNLNVKYMQRKQFYFVSLNFWEWIFKEYARINVYGKCKIELTYLFFTKITHIVDFQSLRRINNLLKTCIFSKKNMHKCSYIVKHKRNPFQNRFTCNWNSIFYSEHKF